MTQNSTESTSLENHIEESHRRVSLDDRLSMVLVALFKGVIQQEGDNRLWTDLLRLQSRVRDYVSVLRLELILDEAEGYAFLRSMVMDSDLELEIDADNGSESLKLSNREELPRLVPRRQLTFHVSLLLALLRKKLAEFDARGGDTKLVLSRDEILDLVKVFMPSSSNETKLVRKIDVHINKIVDMGFLRKMKASSVREDSFEVRRILKAFVDAQWLSEFDKRLEEYIKKLKEEE